MIVHRQQCGDCWGKEHIRGLNGNGEILQYRLNFKKDCAEDGHGAGTQRDLEIEGRDIRHEAFVIL